MSFPECRSILSIGRTTFGVLTSELGAKAILRVSLKLVRNSCSKLEEALLWATPSTGYLKALLISA
jgi:hypothetical protein